MSITRDVILDLLPVYLAGEASADTRELIESYLAQHPDLAREVREGGAEPFAKHSPALPADVELRSLVRTRGWLAVQRWLFGFGIAFTSLAFATRVHFHDGVVQDVRPLILDYPRPFGALLLVAIAFWVVYALVKRRLKTSAL